MTTDSVASMQKAIAAGGGESVRIEPGPIDRSPFFMYQSDGTIHYNLNSGEFYTLRRIERGVMFTFHRMRCQDTIVGPICDPTVDGGCLVTWEIENEEKYREWLDTKNNIADNETTPAQGDDNDVRK